MLDSSIQIRRLCAGDAPALVDFYNGLSASSIRTFRPLDIKATLPVCEAIVCNNQPDSATKYDLVAVADGRIVGWSFIWDWTGAEPMFGLSVADAYHGQGVGSALMDSVMRAAREQGLARVYLTVVRDNDKAWQMYQRRGFVKYGAFTGDDGLPYFRMVAGATKNSAAQGGIPMHWHNEPPEWTALDGVVKVTTGAKTDFWRATHYGFIRDNGHFGFQQVEGNFAVTVKVSGAYRDLYDQAGLMLRLDERHWMKCGIEYVNGVQHVSAVVTNDFSDWSVVPVPDNPPSIWLRVTRQGDAVEVHYSFDGQQYTLLRLAYLPPSAGIDAGIMCASPDGGGFTVTFDGLRIQSL